MKPEHRPPPEWLGDVSAGVDAWTRRAAIPTDVPDVPTGAATDAPTGDRAEASAEPGASRGRRAGGRRRGGRPGAPPEDAVAAGPDADPESVARTILLEQLTGRARSRRELADKLASRNVPDDVAVRLLDRFEEVGLVDDAAFARSWVSGRGAEGPKGLARRALAQELRRKGVDDEVVRDVLDDVDPDAETEAARTLVRRRLRSMSNLDTTVATRRLVGMLARKGYAPGLAFAVVREELAGLGHPDVEPPDAD